MKRYTKIIRSKGTTANGTQDPKKTGRQDPRFFLFFIMYFYIWGKEKTRPRMKFGYPRSSFLSNWDAFRLIVVCVVFGFSISYYALLKREKNAICLIVAKMSRGLSMHQSIMANCSTLNSTTLLSFLLTYVDFSIYLWISVVRSQKSNVFGFSGIHKFFVFPLFLILIWRWKLWVSTII